MLTIIFNITLGLMGIGCVICWALAFKKRGRGEPLFLQRAVEGTPLGLLDVVVMFGFWLVGQVVSVFAAMFLFDIPIEELAEATSSQMAQFMLAVGVIQFIATILALIFIRARYGSFQFLGWKSNLLAVDFRLAIMGFLLVIPITLGVQSLVTMLWEYEHPTLEMMMDGNLMALGSAWLMAFIVAPITEEIFFRGILQNWLQRFYENKDPIESTLIGGVARRSPIATEGTKSLWDIPSRSGSMKDVETELQSTVPSTESIETGSPLHSPSELKSAKRTMPTGMQYWMPIVISSAFFALAHFGQGPAPIPLFFFAMGLGWVFRQTGSVFPCIIMHMMLNGFSLFWFTLPVLFPELGTMIPDPAPVPN